MRRTISATLLLLLVACSPAVAQDDDIHTFRQGLMDMSSTYAKAITTSDEPLSEANIKEASRQAADVLRPMLLAVDLPDCLDDTYVAAWAAYAALDWQADDLAASNSGFVARAFDELNALLLTTASC